MAKLDPPQLRRGDLSGRIYVVTHGKFSEDGSYLDASRKYDVTDQFEALVLAEDRSPASIEQEAVSAEEGQRIAREGGPSGLHPERPLPPVGGDLSPKGTDQ